MDIIKICALAIVALCLIITLKQYKSVFAVCVLIITGVVILIEVLHPFSEIFSFITEVSENAAIPFEEIKLAIKALGIGYIVQFSSDICHDFGETSLASKVELCGKITILSMALPLFKKVLEGVTGMLL